MAFINHFIFSTSLNAVLRIKKKKMQDQQGIIYCYYPSLGSNFFPKYNSILTLEADKTSQGRPGGCGSKVSTRQTVSLTDLTLGGVLGGGRDPQTGHGVGGRALRAASRFWSASHVCPGCGWPAVSCQERGQGLEELPFPAASWGLGPAPKSTHLQLQVLTSVSA